jgi:hypothetical protein
LVLIVCAASRPAGARSGIADQQVQLGRNGDDIDVISSVCSIEG